VGPAQGHDTIPFDKATCFGCLALFQPTTWRSVDLVIGQFPFVGFPITRSLAVAKVRGSQPPNGAQGSLAICSTILTAPMDFIPGPFAVFRPDIPFNKRWELLKPYLHRYYFDEKLKLSQIITIMKEQYGFDAK